jgi:hypothetical protein
MRRGDLMSPTVMGVLGLLYLRALDPDYLHATGERYRGSGRTHDAIGLHQRSAPTAGPPWHFREIGVRSRDEPPTRWNPAAGLSYQPAIAQPLKRIVRGGFGELEREHHFVDGRLRMVAQEFEQSRRRMV